MANLDRFLEELRGFDEHEITENTIKLLEDFGFANVVIKKDMYGNDRMVGCKAP